MSVNKNNNKLPCESAFHFSTLMKFYKHLLRSIYSDPTTIFALWSSQVGYHVHGPLQISALLPACSIDVSESQCRQRHLDGTQHIRRVASMTSSLTPSFCSIFYHITEAVSIYSIKLVYTSNDIFIRYPYFKLKLPV